jgi:hypothetical protein
VRIGSIDIELLTGFPTLSLTLTDVELKDDLAAARPLLQAKTIGVGLNVMRLLHREIDVQSVSIAGATVDLFTDANGATNFDIFKPSPPGAPGTGPPCSRGPGPRRGAARRRFPGRGRAGEEAVSLHHRLAAGSDRIRPDGPRSRLKLEVLARDMTFLSINGSFIKDQQVAGALNAAYSISTRRLSVETDALAIGKDSFAVNGPLRDRPEAGAVRPRIRSRIRWLNASRLLSQNVTRIMDQLDVSKPVEARCVIHGDLNDKRDPAIVVDADVADSEVHIPDGVIASVSFHGRFNNHVDPKKPNGDPNSAVTLTAFQGAWKGIPFQIPRATLVNLLKPVASGTFRTDFGLPGLNDFIDEKLILFSGGQASVDLEFQMAVDELKIHQPRFRGEIVVRQGDLLYKPKNLPAEDGRRSRVHGPETVDPEREVCERRQHPPDRRRGRELLRAVLRRSREDGRGVEREESLSGREEIPRDGDSREGRVPVEIPQESVTHTLHSVIEKCQIVLNMQVDKAVYDYLEATNATGQIVLADGRVGSGTDTSRRREEGSPSRATSSLGERSTPSAGR